MAKPYHEQLLEEGVRQAPQPDSAEEMHRRVVSPSRVIQIAGLGAAALFIVLDVLGQLIDRRLGGAVGLGVLIVIAWVLGQLHQRGKKDAPRAGEASSSDAEVEMRAAAVERERKDRVAADWNAHL